MAVEHKIHRMGENKREILFCADVLSSEQVSNEIKITALHGMSYGMAEEKRGEREKKAKYDGQVKKVHY